MFASSFAALIEPAPCDLIFGLALLSCIGTGLSVQIVIAPLIVFLLTFNFGAMTSYLQVHDIDNKPFIFVATSFYMGITAIFFASYIAQDTMRRAALVQNAWVVGAEPAVLIEFDFEGETVKRLGMPEVHSHNGRDQA